VLRALYLAKNIALAGTLCVSGSGQGLVIQTGDNTVFGRIAKLSSKPNHAMTTLEREIFHFVVLIASLAIATAVLICILWGAWLKKDHPGFITNSGIVGQVRNLFIKRMLEL
jgi:sodium/potassium-transporting ATPase subunit alpha